MVAQDVTGPQYATLVAIAGWPEVDQRRAGELASLDKSTVAGVVRRLEQKGWIDRRPDPHDARRRLLVLSDCAKEQMPSLTAAAAQVQSFLLDPVPEEQRASLIGLLQRVAFRDEEGMLGLAPEHEIDALEMVSTPGYLIRRAQQVHALLWNEILAGDLTSSQYAVLAATAAVDSIDQASIGTRASLDSSTVADVVARLTDKGWLTRDRDPVDRRRFSVSLTGPAVAAMRHLTGSVERVQDHLLARLDRGERAQFVELMQRVARIDPRPGAQSGAGTTASSVVG